MFPSIPATERALIVAVTAPAIYLATVALGRWMKRRSGVRLGIAYQLFCIVLALYVPLEILQLNIAPGPFNLARELGAAAILLGAIFVIALIRRYLWEFYFEQRKQTEIPKFLREIAA